MYAEKLNATPFAPHQFEIHGRYKGKTVHYVVVGGFPRELTVLLRLSRGRATIIHREENNAPIGINGCTDLDNDGEAELWLSLCGDGERYYSLIRLIGGLPSVVMFLPGC